MKKLILIMLIVLASCSDNESNCLAEKDRINTYYDNLIEEYGNQPKVIERLNIDRNFKLKELDCF